MKIGIVGFPGSGKTTIFNTLTGLRSETKQGGKARENTGVIKVPDERVSRLAALHTSKKQVFAEVRFVDVARQREGVESAKGLSSQVLSAMQGCDALVLVLRDFVNPILAEAPHAPGELNGFLTELILTDLAPLEKRSERLKKEGGKAREGELIQKCIAHLEAEQPLRTLGLTENEAAALSGFTLLSAKPLLVLLNQEEKAFAAGLPEALRERETDLEVMAISGKLEMELGSLPAEEQQGFLEALGIPALARDRFVKQAYALLDLISFLTTGPDESRAWPIRRGTTALRAAAKIHSDIQRGFIRAETIAYSQLLECGSEKKAREAGKMRAEGKDYIVQDGDIINFRFNV